MCIACGMDSNGKAKCAQHFLFMYYHLRLGAMVMAWSDFCVCKALEIANSQDNEGAALPTIELTLTNNSQPTNIKVHLNRKCTNSIFCIIYYMTIVTV